MLKKTKQEINTDALKNARELAISLLKTEDDLEKIPQLIRSITEDNKNTRKKLNHIVNANVDQLKVAVEQLNRSNKIIDEFKYNDFMSAITRKARDALILFPENYPLIKKSLITSINIQKTADLLKKLVNIDNEVKKIHDIIKDDSKLFEVYEKISSLETSMNELYAEIKKDKTASSDFFEHYLKSVRGLVKEFTTLIFETILQDEGIILVAKDRPGLLVDIARIIKKESERDDALVRNNQPTKQYKQKLFDTINLGIKMYVIGITKPTSPPKPIPQILEELKDLIIQQLDCAQIDVAPCFPDDFKIVEYYINTINQYIAEYITLLMSDLAGMSYNDKLCLLYWIRIEYHLAIEEFLTKETKAIDFGKDAETLMKEFINDLHSDMLQICKNAVVVDFSSRKLVPTPNSKPYTPSCIELFTLFNSLLDLVIESKNNNRQDFIYVLVKINTPIIVEYTQLLMSNLQDNIKTINLDMIYASANNISMCSPLLDQYLKRIMEVLNSGYHQELFDAYVICYNAFDDLLNYCLKAVIGILLEECDDSIKIVGTENWEIAVAEIVAAIKRCQNYNDKCLESTHNNIFYSQLLEAFVSKLNGVLKTSNLPKNQIEVRKQKVIEALNPVFLEYLNEQTIRDIVYPKQEPSKIENNSMFKAQKNKDIESINLEELIGDKVNLN